MSKWLEELLYLWARGDVLPADVHNRIMEHWPCLSGPDEEIANTLLLGFWERQYAIIANPVPSPGETAGSPITLTLSVEWGTDGTPILRNTPL